MERKNQPGPHRAISSSRDSSTEDNNDDLAAVFGSLRPVAQTFTPSSSSVRSSQPRAHQELSVVKARPDADDNDLLERARSDFAQQNLLMMNGKILRLAEQVGEMRQERSDALEKVEANERTIQELRQQVGGLKAQLNTHHVSIESNKKLLDERGREASQVSTRVDQVQKTIAQQIQQQGERLGSVEALALKNEHQLKDHFGQLKEGDLRVSEIEEDVAILRRKQQQPAVTQTAGNAVPASTSSGRDGPSTTEIKTLQASHAQTNAYLKQVGEKLVDHQNNFRTTDVAINGMRARLEGLHAVMSRISGQKEQSGGIRMDQRDVAFVQLQTQITQLEDQMHEKVTGNARPQSNTADNSIVTGLQTKMAMVTVKISDMDEQLKADRLRQKNHDEIALASKFRLQELFKQLTKEMHGECLDAEEMVFGVDADQLFVLRQRVLERLTIEDKVQVEFERLKVLPA